MAARPTPTTRPRVIVKKQSGGESRTQKHQAEGTETRAIVERYRSTGIWSRARIPPSYGDFTNATDYQNALNSVREAQEAFDSLPSRVRSRFNNRPEELIRFISDPGNITEAVDLGLIAPKREPSAVVPDKAAKPSTKAPADTDSSDPSDSA